MMRVILKRCYDDGCNRVHREIGDARFCVPKFGSAAAQRKRWVSDPSTQRAAFLAGSTLQNGMLAQVEQSFGLPSSVVRGAVSLDPDPNFPKVKVGGHRGNVTSVTWDKDEEIGHHRKSLIDYFQRKGFPRKEEEKTPLWKRLPEPDPFHTLDVEGWTEDTRKGLWENFITRSGENIDFDQDTIKVQIISEPADDVPIRNMREHVYRDFERYMWEWTPVVHHPESFVNIDWSVEG